MNKRISYLLSILIIGLLVFDLLRFGFKYTPFTNPDYLYPQTKTLEFLQKNLGFNRYISDDSRIFPPNFSIMYKLQTLDGYDPLYTGRYGEMMAALERGKADIHTPFGFNRIITAQDYHSRVIDLFGVKYLLAFDEIRDPHFKKVLQEGNTRIYENKSPIPRVFFVQSIYRANNKQDAINYLFDNQYGLRDKAVVENGLNDMNFVADVNSKAKITKYEETKVEIATENHSPGFLVLTDSFYPTWQATIDGKKTKIFLADYNFRGISVPEGKHKIIFYDKLF